MKFSRSVEPSNKGLEAQLTEVIGLLKTVAEKTSKSEFSEGSEQMRQEQTVAGSGAGSYGRGRGRGRGSFRYDGARRGGQGRGRACWGCGAFDHYIVNCTQVKSGQNGEENRQGNEFRPNQGAPEGSQVMKRAPETRK